MSILIWLEAAIKLGLPMAVLGGLMFNWLYGAGQLSRDDGHKAIRERLNELRKQHKTNKSKNGNYLYKQWLFFGGGFYGLAVLWTLLVIEVGELIGFIFNFDLALLLADGIVGLLVNLVVSQLGNVVTALLWFGYWPDGGGGAVVAWVAVGYGGYLFGIHLARENDSLHRLSDLKDRIRLRRQATKVTGATNVTNATNAADATDATDITNATDVTDISSATDATNTTNTTNVTNATNVTDASNVTDITNATKDRNAK